MKILFPAALALQLALVAPSFAQQSASVTPIDGIAAVVNEDVILKSELARAMANVQQQYAGRATELPPTDVLQKQILERLILQRLQVARAQQSGITVDDQELSQAIESIAQNNKVSVDQLRQQLAQQGQSFDSFRNAVRDELLTQRLKQAYAQGAVHVSESEVNAALSAQSQSGTQLHLANIVVALPAGATPEQIAAGQKKVDGVKGLIDRKEMDFTAAAIRYSDAPNALDGGDLGWRAAQEIPAAFSQIVGNMKPGDVAGPIRGATGFQLLKLVEVRDGGAGLGTISQYHTRQILVKSKDPANDAKGKARAETLRARLAGGANFAKTAESDSDDPVGRANGGDTGWRSQDGLGAEVGAAVAALRDGEISQPVQTKDGWVIAQRIASRQGVAASEDQRGAMRETIGRRKLEDAYDRFLREMRGEAYVSTRVGADAEQPLQAAPAAAPEAPPKKKG
ncbi:MAG: peptidylprolyl isomerase [Xanthomonadales bacterium]|nr:peptidylprolyl isomerase [Xanthomonadales bacterium]